MVKKRRKKKDVSRIPFWVIFLLIIGALATVYWHWIGLKNISPHFNYLEISIDNERLKLLNGESINLHPESRIRILDVSTNIPFNRGVRFVSRDLDINALWYEEVPLQNLLPGRNIFNSYRFRLEVKYFNQNIGSIEMTVEPYIEDWLDKTDRTIGSDRKISVLERALEFAPDDERIRDRLIKEYLSLEKWEIAAMMLEEKAKKHPDREVFLDLLKVYEAIGSTENIISVIKKLLEKDPDDEGLRLRLASLLEEMGRIPDAIEEYEKISERSSAENNLSIHKTLGFLYTKTDNPDKAVNAYLKALEIDKSDVNLYYNLSFLYEKIGDREKSNRFLEKALELKTEDVEGRLKLSENLITRGEYADAEKYLMEVLKRRPDSKEALLLMIQIAEKIGDRKKLKMAYQGLLELEPNNKTLIYNLGIMEYEEDNLSDALTFLSKYLSLYPKDNEVRPFLFDIYKRQQKEDLAYKEALFIIKQNPKEKEYYHYLFEYLNKRERYDELIATMEEGLKSHSQDIDLTRYLLLACLKTGKNKPAIDILKKMTKDHPDDVESLVQLAKLQEKEGLLKEALETYRKIIAVSPGHEEAEESYLRLRFEVLPDGE